MTKLLEIKDQLIRFYSKYETYLYPIVKFADALNLLFVNQQKLISGCFHTVCFFLFVKKGHRELVDISLESGL